MRPWHTLQRHLDGQVENGCEEAFDRLSSANTWFRLARPCTAQSRLESVVAQKPFLNPVISYLKVLYFKYEISQGLRTSDLVISNMKSLRYSKCMNLKAAGAYIWYLREQYDLSREEVAAAAGTSDVQIMRIEKGEIDTRGSLLFAVIRIVRGNADDVSQLMHSPNATLTDGRQLAAEWMKQTDELRSETEIEDELAELREIRENLAQQPTFFQEVLHEAVNYIRFRVSERLRAPVDGEVSGEGVTPEPPPQRRSQRSVPPKAS